MRTYEEYHEILSLWESGHNKKQIARITGIPRKTIVYIIQKYEGLEQLEERAERNIEINGEVALVAMLKDEQLHDELRCAYAYLLGIYLGDGYLAKLGRVYKLRIALDAKYPGIIQSCSDAIQSLLPDNRIDVVKCMAGEKENRYLSSVEVTCYYKYWLQVFPQHGVGSKHTRKIELTDWQQRIVDVYPLEFFRGLYHSDGSRSQNIVKGRNYPRYQFTNFSPDIRVMFQNACDKLGLHWTITNVRNVSISRREDVARLDSLIGAKA